MSIDVPVQPHPLIRPIEGGLGDRACSICGLGFDGDHVAADGSVVAGRRFVELRPQGSEPVDPGKIWSQHDEPGQTIVMTRSASDGTPVPTVVAWQIVCSACIEVAARIVGFGDLSLQQIELDQTIDRAERAEQLVAERDQEIAELREGARVAGALTRLFEAEKSEKSTNRRSSRATS
jgi:hypothetical protein